MTTHRNNNELTTKTSSPPVVGNSSTSKTEPVTTVKELSPVDPSVSTAFALTPEDFTPLTVESSYDVNHNVKILRFNFDHEDQTLQPVPAAFYFVRAIINGETVIRP